MGPFWDYNLAYGNADYCDGWNTSGWEQDAGCIDVNNNPFWFDRLLDDIVYQNKLQCRWNYLRSRSFHQDSINYFIDSLVLYLNDAQIRNFQRWPILGNYVWPNYYVGYTYQEEIDYFKDWIADRLVWIDNNLSGNCFVSWNCVNNICVDPGDGTGTYSDLVGCIDNCGATSSSNLESKNRNLIKKIDMLGRISKGNKNQPLFYIYDDGSVDKIILLD
tara:strand:- start:216 stop:869 length:654 start_codon:yes stop_codon:yes gene_type:complete